MQGTRVWGGIKVWNTCEECLISALGWLFIYVFFASLFQPCSGALPYDFGAFAMGWAWYGRIYMHGISTWFIPVLSSSILLCFLVVLSLNRGLSHFYLVVPHEMLDGLYKWRPLASPCNCFLSDVGVPTWRALEIPPSKCYTQAIYN